MENSTVTKPTIQFEDLEKLDIRLCKIETCEKVEGTDKLYVMQISLGEEKRTVVSAIADRFPKELLIGKNYPFVLNLAPRKIRGIQSEAMIIMSERSDGSYVRLFTEDDQDINSKVF